MHPDPDLDSRFCPLHGEPRREFEYPRTNLQRMLRDPGIETGDAPDSDLFPIVAHRR